MKLEEAWAEFAYEIGAKYSSREVIASNFRGWAISLAIRVVETRGPYFNRFGEETYESTERMVMSAHYQSKARRDDVFWFYIQRKNFLHRLFKFIWRPGIHLGSPEIDRNFRVLSNDPTRVRELFRKQRIQQLIHCLPSTTLKRTAPTATGALLGFTVKRPIKDSKRLRCLFDFFVEILDWLYELGLAERQVIPSPSPRLKPKVQRPRTKSAFSKPRRLKLFEGWLKYLCYRSGTFVIFEGDKGGLVQFSYSPDSRSICMEVVTNLWEDFFDEPLSKRVIKRLADKGFYPPETIESSNYWQEIDEEERRSIAILTEWAFREVYGEGMDYTVKMSDFV